MKAITRKNGNFTSQNRGNNLPKIGDLTQKPRIQPPKHWNVTTKNRDVGATNWGADTPTNNWGFDTCVDSGCKAFAKTTTEARLNWLGRWSWKMLEALGLWRAMGTFLELVEFLVLSSNMFWKFYGSGKSASTMKWWPGSHQDQAEGEDHQGKGEGRCRVFFGGGTRAGRTWAVPSWPTECRESWELC